MPSARQGGKLDDITVVMAIVDEEDVHVVRAQPLESEEEGDEDAVETLVSDSEGVFVDPDADEAVPAEAEPKAPAAQESSPEPPAAPTAGPSAGATPAARAVAAAAAIPAPAGHAAALSNGHVAVRQQHTAAPAAVVAQQSAIVSQAALCCSDTVRLPVVCSVTGKALQFYSE